MVNGAIFCFNLGGILNYLLIQPYIIDGEWVVCCFNHKTLVVNGAICCFNLGGILGDLLIQPYILDGE